MKKIITLSLIFGFATFCFSQEISICEQELNTRIKPSTRDNTWYELNNSYRYDCRYFKINVLLKNELISKLLN